MANRGNPGIAKMADVLDKRMRAHTPKALDMDFGEITSGYQLKPNNFSKLIPPSDYEVCRQLTIGNVGEYLTNVTTPEGNGQAYIPESMRKLKPGDRVVFIWVQNTPVVLDIIVKADKL